LRRVGFDRRKIRLVAALDFHLGERGVGADGLDRLLE
jgi:hypothetical protein